MKSYKLLLNELKENDILRQLTDQESVKLRQVLLNAFLDLQKCCQEHDLTLMLIGGTALGSIRHKGFIPWDDDLDVAMPREDYEKLKILFDRCLGERYVLASPNYHGNARNRFPMMLIKGTRFLEVETRPDDAMAMIKVDIFIIENVPQRKIIRILKGLYCTMLMFISAYADTYFNHNTQLKTYMCETAEGKKVYNRRMFIGHLFSFRSAQRWFDAVDRAFQYKKKTTLMSIPSGRGHYFGEICRRESFLPPSNGVFEGITVQLPAKPRDYLSNLYGSDYMVLPSKEKQERHFVVDIQFGEE